jgi:hypothetical protein
VHGSGHGNTIAEGDIDGRALRNPDGGSRNLKRLPFLGERIRGDNFTIFRLRMPDTFSYFEMQAENLPAQFAGRRPVIVGDERRQVTGTQWSGREQNQSGSH